MSIDFAICSLFWIIYAIVEGIKEAYSDHHESISKSNIEMKMRFVSTIQRIIMLSLLSYILFINNGLTNSILFAISAILAFIYVHNEIYFKIRMKLDPQTFALKEEKDCLEREKPYIYVKNSIRKRTGIFSIFFQLLLSITN